MTKLWASICVAAAGMAILAGCAEATTPGGSIQPSGKAVSVNAHYVDLPDGRKLLCVYEGNANDGRSGGPSCDWDNAR